MDIITGTIDSLPRRILLDLACYRHEVFVQRLGWQLQSRGGLELDEFDHCGTHYLVARDAHARIVGTARLLPTTGPYLLAEAFPQLLGSTAPPRSPFMWELSRFTALDLHARSPGRPQGLVSLHALDLLAAAMCVAAKHGVHQLISVSPLGIERILKAAGVNCQRAGEPVQVDGQMLFACLMDVDLGWRATRRVTPARGASRPRCAADSRCPVPDAGPIARSASAVGTSVCPRGAGAPVAAATEDAGCVASPRLTPSVQHAQPG